MTAPNSLLTIAGTSPITGAGVTADIQVFRDFGFHGAWVPTALLDQDTTEIRSVQPVDSRWLAGTVRSAIAVAQPAGIKVGLIHNQAVLGAMVDAIAPVAGSIPVVVDPVLASGWGTPLHERALADAIRDRLLPLTTVVTPNAPEAAQLAGMEVTDLAAAENAARALLSAGAEAVLVKGGHLDRAPGDVLAQADGTAVLSNDVRFAADVHGTGCCLSSAILALLAHGFSISEACRRARRYLIACVSIAQPLPGGGRPVITHGRETSVAARRLSA